MPKNTFYNLDDEKRILIEEIATTEFAQFGYDQASVNNIVKKAGIAKGSFYQYFEDKKDLFNYLVTCVLAAKKIQYLAPVLSNPDQHDFFTLMHDMYTYGLAFASLNPENEQITTWIANNMNHPVVKDLYNTPIKESTDFFYNLVIQAQERGEIDANLDARYISHMIPKLAAATFEYCLEKNKHKKQSDFTIVSTDMQEAIDLMIDLLKSGLGKK